MKYTIGKTIVYGIGLMVILGPERQVVSCKFMIIFEYEKSQDKSNSFGGWISTSYYFTTRKTIVYGIGL